MTISSSASTVTRNGNGVATSFSFPFKVWDTSQLEVYILDADGAPTKTTDWTASLSDPGGSVTYPAVGTTKLPTGWKIVILRNMPFTQESDYVNATPFMAETVETALDVLTAGLQQVKEVVDRSVKIDPGSTDPDAYLTEIRAAVVSTAADAVSCGEDAASTAADRSTVAADKALVAADKATVAADKATVAADKGAVAADKATVAADKATVAADKATAVSAKDTAVASAATATAQAGIAATQAGIATTKAGEAETARAAAVVAKEAAEAAAANVGNYKEFQTGTAGQTVITLPWAYDPLAGNIFLIIGGTPQMPDAYTLTDSTHITLDDPLAGGETIAVYSIPTPAGPAVPLYASANLGDLLNLAAALSNLGLTNAAKTDVVQSYAKQHYAAARAILSSAGALAVDCDLDALATTTLSENTTVAAATNHAKGKIVELEITGASTYTLSWNTNWKATDLVALPSAPAAGKKLWVVAESDGTYMQLRSAVKEA